MGTRPASRGDLRREPDPGGDTGPRVPRPDVGIRPGRDEEVVCHNDLAPKNTVYRDGGTGLRPTALIDWDIAAPGRRIDDVAHVCWQYLHLGPDVSDVEEAARRIGVILQAYGLDDPEGVVDAILRWQDRCWRGIEAGAAAGDPRLMRLSCSGVVREVQRSFAWVKGHRSRLAGVHTS